MKGFCGKRDRQFQPSGLISRDLLLRKLLFHIVGGLTPATSGVVRLSGQDVGAL
jgi:hypothetical protein